MKILITGGAGYVGSVLTRNLIKKGHDVTVYDALFFGRKSLVGLANKPNFRLVKGDIRDRKLLAKEIQGKDAVIHLAAIVGDPACAADADLAIEVNFNATVLAAELAKRAGIKKFVFASTCSVYGASQGTVNERSKLNPVSHYAQTRLYGENGIKALAEGSFKPTILRFGTVYGLSPRMRFDLIVNFLTKKTYREGAISIFGGKQWRPLIHVSDVAMAVENVLEAKENLVAGKIFNVGKNSHNYQFKQFIPIFEKISPGVKAVLIEKMEDQRSYRVNFDKIKRALNFSPVYDLESGIREMFNALKAGQFKDAKRNARYYNHKIIINGKL